MGKFQTKKICISLLLLVSVLVANSQCFINANINTGPKLKTTGSAKLDAILVDEAKGLKELFAIEVELYAYDDQNTPNAYASPICNSLNCDGSVKLGKTLLLDEIVTSNGYISVQGIMAHEYAHIVQFQQKSKLTGKYAELQADFLSGWYLGKSKYLKLENLEPFANSLYEKGDFYFWSVQHHGTPEERASTMIAGFKFAELTLDQAYNKSIEILKNVNVSKTETATNNSTTIKTKQELAEKTAPAVPIIPTSWSGGFKDPKSNNKFLSNPEIEEAISSARNLLSANRYNDCIKIWVSLTSKYPDFSVGYYNLGITRLLSGDKINAKPDFEKAFSLGLLDTENIIRRYYLSN
jgi:hypothetical protein